MRKTLPVFIASAALAAAAACSSSDTNTLPNPAGPDAGGGGDSAAPPDDSGAPPDSPSGDAGTGSVTFRYTPGWKGVKQVDVIGSFGQATDWTAPLVTLTDDGSGNFTGTASVAPGTYTYLFKVTGDADDAKPDQFVRYAFDPANSSFAACPDKSPSFNKNNPAEQNPCAQVSVPQGSAAPTFHIKGTVNHSGAAAAGYLVEVERQEAAPSHHYFANRTTTGADGSFDLPVAQGHWRLQVLHPTFMKETDAQRDPLQNDALRRAIGAAMDIAADVTVDPVEMKYDGYAAMTPQGDASVALPATLTFTILSDAKSARAALYGPGNNIGDPWYTSATGAATSVSFDGKFTTKQAPPDAGAVTPGTKYYWGTEQDLTHADGGVAFTGQSMVFPVTFQ
jgi:hypothetical protein